MCNVQIFYYKKCVVIDDEISCKKRKQLNVTYIIIQTVQFVHKLITLKTA